MIEKKGGFSLLGGEIRKKKEKKTGIQIYSLGYHLGDQRMLFISLSLWLVVHASSVSFRIFKVEE